MCECVCVCVCVCCGGGTESCSVWANWLCRLSGFHLGQKKTNRVCVCVCLCVARATVVCHIDGMRKSRRLESHTHTHTHAREDQKTVRPISHSQIRSLAHSPPLLPCLSFCFSLPLLSVSLSHSLSYPPFTSFLSFSHSLSLSLPPSLSLSIFLFLSLSHSVSPTFCQSL